MRLQPGAGCHTFNRVVEDGAALDQTFAALADPTRRAILTRLRAGPSTIGELAEPFTISFAAVSKHVRVLERAGLLERDVRGREHHCRLVARPLRSAAAWTAAYREFWERRLDALDGWLRERGKTGRRRR